MRPLATFSFFIFLTTFSFFPSPHPSFFPVPPSSSSLLPPRPSFFLVPPSSSSLLPPRPSFLPVPPSSPSLPPPHPSFFLIQHGLNHLESVKVHFSSILTKALPTNRPTNRPTDRRTMPLIKMRTHLKMGCNGINCVTLFYTI